MVKFIGRKVSPAYERDPTPGTDRLSQVWESGNRFGEKHGAEARECGIEGTGRELICLNVSAREIEMGRVVRAGPCHVNRRLDNIHPEDVAVFSYCFCDSLRRVANAATEIKDALSRQQCHCFDGSLAKRLKLLL